MLDNRLDRQFRVLGWAFVVTDGSGEFLVAVRGLRLERVDNFQGAELWAIWMALQHVPSPKPHLD